MQSNNEHKVPNQDSPPILNPWDPELVDPKLQDAHTDQRLFDVYRAVGLMEESPSTTYDQERVIKLMRLAYSVGVRDTARDIQAFRNATKANPGLIQEMQRHRGADEPSTSS